MSKKNKQQLKRDRAISRNKRNAIRREIAENVLKHRNANAIHVLFIVEETENMEKILLNLTPLENKGQLFNLPILPAEMLDKFPDKSLKEILLCYFGIEAEEIEQIDDLNLIIAKKIKIINKSPELVEIMVRPYNKYTWYPITATSLYGERIFRDNDLKEHFVINGKIKNIYMFQDTITEILIYRAHAQKVNFNNFILRQNWPIRHVGEKSLDLILAETDEELQAILANEPQEIMELESGYSSYKKNLTRALKTTKKEEEE